MKKTKMTVKASDWIIPAKCPDCRATIVPSYYDSSGGNSFTNNTGSMWSQTQVARFALCVRCGWRKLFQWKPWA